MNPSSEREAFEAWCLEYHEHIPKWTGSRYRDDVWEDIWAGWQSRAALSTQPQQVGWKMVPVTITDEMRSAAMTAWVHTAAFYGKPCAGQRAWEAAVNAAPLPPVPGQEGEQP